MTAKEPSAYSPYGFGEDHTGHDDHQGTQFLIRHNSSPFAGFPTYRQNLPVGRHFNAVW